MSGAGLSLRSKSRRRLGDPVLASALAKCTSILKPTATSGLIASLGDTLNPASPATQTNSATQPTAVAAANGVPEMLFGGSLLDVPCIAARVGSPRWGIAMWLQSTGVAGTTYILNAAVGAGCNAGRLDIVRDLTNLIWDVTWAAFSVRRATAAGVFGAGTRVFVTCEFDGTQATEATRAVMTVNAVPVVPAFNNDSGAPNNMPTTLVQPTGTYALGSATSPGVGAAWQGRMGAIYVAQPAVSLAGGGIWTPAERVALMNNLRPI
jgi:hypothetical protein